MKRVLRRLGYIDEFDVVMDKGRVACEINSADELLITELIYENVFSELTPQQCVALLASIVFQEKVSSLFIFILTHIYEWSIVSYPHTLILNNTFHSPFVFIIIIIIIPHT